MTLATPAAAGGLPDGIEAGSAAAIVYRYLERQPAGHSVPVRKLSNFTNYPVASELSSVLKHVPRVFTTTVSRTGKLWIRLA
jgi:hypothetical protein